MSLFRKMLLTFLLMSPQLAWCELNYQVEIIPPLLCPTTCLKDGIYVGGSLGYDNYHVRQSGNFIDGTGDFFTINPTLSAKGWAGNLFVGYGQYFGWIYIAGELIATLSSAQANYTITSDTSEYETHLSIRESYGAAILPGFRINNKSLIYARLGAVRTAIESDEKVFGLPGRTSTSTDKWQNGLQFGFGIETLIFENWSLRGDYTYTTYNAQTSELNTQFSASNNEFMLGLLYHFC